MQQPFARAYLRKVPSSKGNNKLGYYFQSPLISQCSVALRNESDRGGLIKRGSKCSTDLWRDRGAGAANPASQPHSRGRSQTSRRPYGVTLSRCPGRRQNSPPAVAPAAAMDTVVGTDDRSHRRAGQPPSAPDPRVSLIPSSARGKPGAPWFLAWVGAAGRTKARVA